MQKTIKAFAKRFKVSARGKIFTPRAGKRHLLQGKSGNRRRRLRGYSEVSPTDKARITQSLPFGLR